ncbi:MAG: hypothetical protein IKU80_05220, partial [Firmicutes bacterium]|nr:hypothetical protein [Bacillota bacterium]
MSGKADINEVPAVLYGLSYETLGQKPEFIQRRHLPDNIVSHPDIVQDRVHLRKSAPDPVKRRH